MRFSERSSVSSWTHLFPETVLRPALWALAMVALSVGFLVPEGLRAQVPQNLISQPCTACYTTSVHAVDVDGDGDKDVLSASQFDNKIA